MGCIKGKQKAKQEKGNYRCGKCGGCSKNKKELCKPEQITEEDTGKTEKKKKNKDKKKKKDKK